MTVNETVKKIQAVLDTADDSLSKVGLVKRKKIFFTDKNLSERTDFADDCILVFGDIAIGTPDMEEDDFCDYSVCVEIKTGLVNDDELNAEIESFEAEIASLTDALSVADSAEAAILAISEKQTAEAEKAAEEFQLEMKKMKLKLYLALGIGLFIIALVLIGGWLLK